jgi:DNA-binding CsgD family transcriptional regulator
LVPSLKRRASSDHRLRSTVEAERCMAAAIEAVDTAAMIITQRGEVIYTNVTARALWGARRQMLLTAFEAAVTGRDSIPGVDVTRISNGDTWLVVARERNSSARLSDCVSLSAARWKLGDRAQQVLQLLVEGCSNSTISETLGITVRAVELQVSGLLDRAAVTNRSALIACVLGPGRAAG